MFGVVVGALIFFVGVSMVGNFWNLAGRMFEHAATRINPGIATVNTFRLGGVVAISIGIFWIATAFSEIS